MERLYGTLEFSFSRVMLPLETAHKVQALLATGTQVDTIWADHKVVRVMVPYSTPAVNVATTPEHDARNIPTDVYRAWREAIERGENVDLDDWDGDA